MAISTVKICNAALSLIGEIQITNATLPTNNGTEAEIQCRLMFPILRDKLLRDHPWNFAEKRQVLAASTTTPDFEFDYYYPLPADCIRALRLYDSDEMYRTEADNQIATNATPCNLIYTKQITDVTQFDTGFTQALIYALAAHLSMALTDNRTLASELRVQSDRELSKAKMFDAQESYPYKRRNKNSWLNSRRAKGGVGNIWGGWR